MIVLIVLVSLILLLIYYYNIKSYNYWKKRKVSCIKPWPVVGSMGSFIFGKKSLAELVEYFYNKYPSTRYMGMVQFSKPTLVITNVELIKQVAIKDFNYFVDRRTFVTEENDPLFGKSLFALTGQKWKNMRSTLSPAFTSGKMKTMFILIADMAKQFTNHLSQRVRSNNIVSLEMKDLFTRFANDVIATSAFGIQCDSIKNRDNEFYRMGQRTIFDGFVDSLKLFGYTFSPAFMEFLSIKLFDDKVCAFFRDIVINTIKIRNEKGITRPDMIHLLMEARKNDSKINLSDDDIASQAIFFFFAGFETTSTLLCHMANELAQNPDIQEKLQCEIDKTIAQHGDNVSYEAIMDMKYLDMVINETLRKWPTVPVVDRKCVQDYVLTATEKHETDLHIQKDDFIWIPIYGLHRDPKYFPNPTKFDPERFKSENNIQSFTYLPFGIGPRNCIGARFALMEAKVLYFHILSKFNIIVVERTQIPFKQKRFQFNIHAENGFWVGFTKRN